MNDNRRAGRVANTNGRNDVGVDGYNFLIRMSRRLGAVATRSSALRDVRMFMTQEITYDSLGHMFTGNNKNENPRDSSDKGGATKDDSVNTAASNNDDETDPIELKRIVSRSHETLANANTVFPLTLFPDTITVDRTKVTITRRDFFWSSDVLSIRIEDVLNVAVSVGPLFGSLTIASRVMSTVDHFRIDHFWRHDAIRLKHIIQGYMIAQHNKIDTAHLSRNELIETLMELGHDTNV